METALPIEPASTMAVSRRGIILPLLAAVLVMLTVLNLPRAGTDLDMDSDTSLTEVLGYAHQHGLQFGTDLAFTYGPLGYLVFFYFSPHSAPACIVADTLFCFTAAAGLCLVAWRARLVWGCALLAIFMFVVSNVVARADLIMDAGLLSWGLLCFVESGRRLTAAAISFVAFAVFCALAKNSVLFSAGAGIVLVAGDLVLRGRPRLGAGMVAGFAAGIVLAWVAVGQAVSHLGAHLVSALAVIQAYNDALGWEALLRANTNGLVVIVLATALVVIRALTAFREPNWRTACRRVVLLAWLGSLLFLSWKHGFVRGDTGHLVYFFGFVPLLALALEIVPGEWGLARLWARVMGIVCCLVSLFTMQSLIFPPLSLSLTQPIRYLTYHARCLLRPREYIQSMDRVIEANRIRARLPMLSETIGHATVDVFGQQQIYILLNNLNYHPRPIFQSYAACSERLMRLNERFYLSPAAPEYVTFVLGPIDRKFPPLEDAMVFRDLLLNYRFVGAEGPFLLLKHESSEPPRLTLLREGVVSPGERLELGTAAGTNLWVQLQMQPTLLGRLRGFFLRPAPVWLAAWGKGPKPLLAHRRAPAPMLAAGFVASPLLLRNPDVRAYFTGEDPPRPDAYSVELLPGEQRFWQDKVHYRIYQFAPGKGS